MKITRAIGGAMGLVAVAWSGQAGYRLWEANQEIGDAITTLRDTKRIFQEKESALQKLVDEGKALRTLREGVWMELDLLNTELESVKKEASRIENTILKKEEQLEDTEQKLLQVKEEEDTIQDSKIRLESMIVKSNERLVEAREAAKRAKFDANPLNHPLLRGK